MVFGSKVMNTVPALFRPAHFVDTNKRIGVKRGTAATRDAMARGADPRPENPDKAVDPDPTIILGEKRKNLPDSTPSATENGFRKC
jgi:hypothetical protein